MVTFLRIVLHILSLCRECLLQCFRWYSSLLQPLVCITEQFLHTQTCFISHESEQTTCSTSASGAFQLLLDIQSMRICQKQSKLNPPKHTQCKHCVLTPAVGLHRPVLVCAACFCKPCQRTKPVVTSTHQLVQYTNFHTHTPMVPSGLLRPFS